MSFLFSNEWGTHIGLDDILLPLEGFPSEIMATEVALYLAECSGANMTLLHIDDKKANRRKGFEMLKTLINKKAKQLNVKYKIKEVVSSQPETVILSSESKYDILVIGASRRLKERVFGDTSSSVIRKSSKPIIAITSPLKRWEEREKSIKKILVPLRNIEEDKGAIKLAVNLTSSATSKDFLITVLNVITLPQSTPLTKEINGAFAKEEKNFLKDVGELFPLVARPLNPQVILGRDVGRAVVSYAEESGIDLIILGEKDKPSPLRRLVGAKALYISQHAPCSVAMIFKPT